MRQRTRALTVTTALVAALALVAGCSNGGSGGGGDPTSGGSETTGAAGDGGLTGDFTVLCYECTDADSVWQTAAQILRDENPDLNVVVESTSFPQLQANAQLLFQSDDAPDVVHYNQGNATVGNLAATGVLADITDAAASYGWDQVLPESLQTVSKYDPDSGLMSTDGQWYGLSVQGEYAGVVYYDKDMFAEHGIEIPTTLDELEQAMQSFLDAGVEPLATEGAETATQHIWYQLALSQADRQWINDYQLYENPVDWSGPELTYATETFDEWVKKGFIPSTSAGLKAEEMVTAFLAQEFPIMISGSWWFGRLLTDATFEWSVARFPGSTFSLGATGKLWVVPEAAKNKEAAYEFLDIILTDPAVQGEIATTGGLAYNASVDAIGDPMVQEFQSAFDSLLADDGIGLYPDWPSPGLFDQLNSSLQGLINQNLTPQEALEQIEAEYDAGKADLGL